MDGGEEKLLDTLISLLVRNFYNLIECAHYTDNQHRIMLLGERDYILESLLKYYLDKGCSNPGGTFR